LRPPVADAEVAYRLHLLGLAGGFEVLPAYLRTEERLRSPVPRGLVTWATVDEALAAAAAPDADRAWFTRRWEAGEDGLFAPVAAGLSALVEDMGWRRALDVDVGVVVSPALRPLPALAATSALVAVGVGCQAPLVGLGVVAVARRAEAMFPADLPAETRRFAALMAAGTAALEHLTGAALDALLVDVVHHVLPPQHRGEEVARHVGALTARRLLDQPPGEIERTIHGLARRRADRVHRAWTRGFFVPRGGWPRG